MALNGSGPISIAGSTTGQSIALEFNQGATSQLSLSQLYRGGGIVPNSAANANIPTSGAISLSNFYNAVRRISSTVNLTSPQANFVLSTSNIPSYSAGAMDVTVNIPSGITISSSSTSSPAFTVSSLSTGDVVYINNSGGIYGAGGSGNSSPGGTALDLAPTAATVQLNNSGIIAGGGGSGGVGRGVYITYNYTTGKYNDPASWTGVSRGGGGGGGGGTSPGSGGAGGNGVASSGYPMTYYASAASGGSGNSIGGGSGGTGDYGHWYVVAPNYYSRGGYGGSGGSWGSYGSAGGNAYYSGEDIGSNVWPAVGGYGVYSSRVTSDLPAGSGGAAGTAIRGTGRLTGSPSYGSTYGPYVS